MELFVNILYYKKNNNFLGVLSALTDTKINCTTGDKGATNFARRSLLISVNSNRAMIEDGIVYFYGL